MRARIYLSAAAALLAVVALFLPTGWYDAIPRGPGITLPFRGVTLLRLAFAAESAVLAWLAIKGVRFVSMPYPPGSILPPRPEVSFDVSRGSAVAVLFVATVLGLLLRTYNLGQDLWLDEITPLRDYSHLSPVQVMGSYLRSNNHLLNTLLTRVSVSAFGESEWSARLPAVIFGTLTIPALYWVGRIALSRIASAGAALALAASYHHVFFSQNARGYAGYVLFALLSTGFLLQALRDDRLWRWGLYVAAVLLGGASLLLMGFVLAGHVLLCLMIAVTVRRRGVPLGPFVRRISAVLAVAGFLVFQIYSTSLPEAYVVLTSVYADPATGFALFSLEFVGEAARGIAAGFGNPIFAVAFLGLGAAGYAALATYSWPLAVGLTLPSLLTAAALGIRGLTFSPRFFLLLLPLAFLAAVSAVQAAVVYGFRKRAISGRMAPRAVALASGILAFAAGRSLPYYYRTPKQPYRAALAIAEANAPTGRIAIVSNAAGGFQYYARRMPVADPSRYVYTRSLSEFDSLSRDSVAPIEHVLTTFPRALQIELPGIAARLERDWAVDTTLAATIGDGEITIWSRKPRSSRAR